MCNPTISTARNRISQSGYSYDENGSLTQNAAGERFGYDAENHQKEFFAEGNSSSDPDATYLYDGEGRRVKKVSAAETTIFVYDASSQLIAEYSTELAETPQVSYLTTDHLGSPRVITNESGAVTSRKDFTAFGEESATAQRTPTVGYSGTAEIRQGYTGYEKDDESGLDFAQARYYNSVHGRYTSVDPLTASASIKNPQTFNRYSYVLNSPYKFTDPLGLIPETTGANGTRGPGSASLLPGGDGLYGAFTGRNPFSQAAHVQQQQTQTPPPAPSPQTSNGDPAIVFDKIEVFDVLDDTPTSSTTPPRYGDANQATPVDLGFNPGATTFFVKASVSVENDGSIVASTNPERPDIFNTRVEAGNSADAESNSGRGRKLDLAPFPGSDPPINQKLDVAESGKTATLTFAVKLSNDYLKMNTFTVTVYGVSNRVFGPNGKINTQNTFRGTLKIRFELPKPKPAVNPFIKKPPFQ